MSVIYMVKNGEGEKETGTKINILSASVMFSTAEHNQKHMYHCVGHQLQVMHHQPVCNTALMHCIRASLGDKHASVGCQKGSEAAM